MRLIEKAPQWRLKTLTKTLLGVFGVFDYPVALSGRFWPFK
jgi:hypothetical protein